MKFLSSFLILVLISFSSMAFVPQRTILGESFTWENQQNLILFFNPANSSMISDSDLLIRSQAAAAQWNQVGGPTISLVTTTGSSQSGRNDIYFSNNSSFFSGSSVLAVTESIYNEATGRIIESDIILKDSILFSNNPFSSPYVGDVLAHEMGHLVGLDHSSLPFSSMFYKLTRGQNTVSNDDLLGKETIYSNFRHSGSVSGRVAGGASATGVFGADVQLISSNSGTVIASTLTDANGYFKFEGVEGEDTFYLFIAPIKVKSSLSPFYETVRNDFCSGFSGYRGGFFKSCDNSREGHPQGITLTQSNSSVDVGTITIKCGLDVPIGYLSSRGGTFELDSQSSKKGDSFVGYFTQAEVDSNSIDEILIDLSDVDTTAGNLFLDLKLLYQDFYSKVSFEMEVSSPSSTYNYSFGIDGDGNPRMNLDGKIPLDPSVSSNNIFTVKITPTDFTSFRATSGFSLDSFFFPDDQNSTENRLFYQFIYFISQQSGSEYSVFGHYDYGTQRGNLKCMEGSKTYSVKPAGAVTGITFESFNKKKSEDSALACGSVDIQNGPPGGGNVLIILLGFLMAFALPKSRKTA
jgi:hypothetical protein